MLKKAYGEFQYNFNVYIQVTLDEHLHAFSQKTRLNRPMNAPLYVCFIKGLFTLLLSCHLK